MIRWAVFVSGSGTNLQAVLDLEGSGRLRHQTIALIHADRDCYALERAKKQGKDILLLSPKQADFLPTILNFLQEKKIDRIFLLGYMRILSDEFLRGFAKPIINLHPSKLPLYKGLDAVRQAIKAGEDEIGVSLHEVVAELDSGPVLRQKLLKREPQESFESLMQRVHKLEHELVCEYLLDLDRSLELE